MKHNRLIFSVFAALSLVAPVAFAQDAAQSTSQTTAPTERAEPVEQAEIGQQADAAAPAQQEAQKITWADLDSDKDGKLNKTEAQGVASLAQVFDEADGDKDGALSADEYKAYLAKSGK